MEGRIEEGNIKGAIETISIEKAEKIIDQMKKCVCKIKGNKIGTGFFCQIKYQKEKIPVLMTYYHIIDDNYIENKKQINVYINETLKIININKKSKIYSSSNEKYDLMIIKLQKEEINNYFELDQNIFLDKSEISYEDQSIYILHYPNGGNISVSYGYGIKKDSQYDIRHLCNTNLCSSGAPILNLSNNKIIGIHKGCIQKSGNNLHNIGTFLKYPLKDLSKSKSNEINLKVKINPFDIDRDVYFLDDMGGLLDSKGIMHYHDHIKELNKNNTELYINNKKYEYKKFFRTNKEGIYSIKLKFNISLKNCSYMFYNCFNIIDIDFSHFNTENITNIECMFHSCHLKQFPDISNWNTKNVTNMKGLFYWCNSLQSIPDISKWNTEKVTKMSNIFYGCKSLQSLPDISKWNTKKVIKMNNIFSGCESLQSLPDISKWNTKKVTKMNNIFSG